MIRLRYALHECGTDDLHVPGKHDEVRLILLQLLHQELLVRRLVRRGTPEERNVVLLGKRAQGFVIRQNHDQLAVQDALVAIGDQALQAVRLATHQHGHPLRLLVAVQANGHIHVNLFADALEAQDQLIEIDTEVAQVHEHRHDEESLHHPLLDVFDVDVARRQVRRNPRHNALLVVPDDGDDCQVLRHA